MNSATTKRKRTEAADTDDFYDKKSTIAQSHKQLPPFPGGKHGSSVPQLPPIPYPKSV